MKQQLISFLGRFWMPSIERIEESNVTNNPAVDVFPTCNFFSHELLMTLIGFAYNNGYLYYIDIIGGDVRMRLYNDVES